MNDRPDTNDYRALFLADVPMMDVRAPAEFEHGAFPGSVSLPLMNNEERARVGICFRHRGQAAAIELGHCLVSGEVKAQRLAQWLDFARSNPQGYLYCFRGGLRSQTVQQWLREQGVSYPLVLGGYKAMRRFLLDQLESSLASVEPVLIGGKTGTGKTRVISRLSGGAIDLEGLARHRGSTFGQLPEPQPSQIDFENLISIALMKLLASGRRRLFLEDEGRLIGRLSLPEALREKMKSAPMVLVEHSLAERVDIVFQDYVVDLGRRYRQMCGDEGPRRHGLKLQEDLARIRKRLGGQKYQEVTTLMAQGFAQQQGDPDPCAHRGWITVLLRDYYDPMYEYQLTQRTGKVLFCGSRDAVVDWIVQES